MKIAIHNSPNGFHPYWITYCKENNIPYKIVDCYAKDLINQLKDCDALMWHHHQANPKDILVAKPILFSLKQAGMSVFPDFNTNWHFDDKLGQKYLLEAIGAPLVPTYVFFDKQEALAWAGQTGFPKVFKLRGGAGSQNVRLVKSKTQAKKLIGKAFGKGFRAYDATGSLKERWRKYRLGKTKTFDVLKGVARLLLPPPYARMGREKGYIYFQDFIPDNDYDIRIIVIGDKAFAIKRMVRRNDFRASGSGHVKYEKQHFSDEVVRHAFNVNEKLRGQCVTMDFVVDKGEFKIVEISYGFIPEVYDPCPGYWDKDLNWHEGKFNRYGWMVESVLENMTDEYVR